MLLSNLFYPLSCACCRRYIGPGERTILCAECIRRLPRTEQAIIRQNSTEMAVLGQPTDVIRAAKVMHLGRAVSFLFYEKDHAIRALIHKMKYADQPKIGYELGRQAAMELYDTGFFDSPEGLGRVCGKMDVIIPMPLHTKRMRERGYNQSEYIARGISDYTGIPIDTTHVTRTRNTPKQALQDEEGRRTNVRGAFAVNHPEQLYHKHILVVDDLITTGETMGACLEAMRKIRGATISVFALCKAR